MADITLRKVSGQSVDTVPNGTIITIKQIKGYGNSSPTYVFLKEVQDKVSEYNKRVTNNMVETNDDEFDWVINNPQENVDEDLPF